MYIYRVFIKYCVFFQEFSKVFHLLLASTRLLLVYRKNYQPIGVTVHSHCVESFEGLLQRCRQGRGCNELLNNSIFPEHPVCHAPLSMYPCTLISKYPIMDGIWNKLDLPQESGLTIWFGCSWDVVCLH